MRDEQELQVEKSGVEVRRLLCGHERRIERRINSIRVERAAKGA